jgi:hypothetical protein
MDSPNDRLNNFMARSGAGFDAAGRPVYSGSGMMYMGPGEFARTQQVHNQLAADAASTDPQSALIRKLLDELSARKARSSGFMFDPPQQPSQGNTTVHYGGQ